MVGFAFPRDPGSCLSLDSVQAAEFSLSNNVYYNAVVVTIKGDGECSTVERTWYVCAWMGEGVEKT